MSPPQVQVSQPLFSKTSPSELFPSSAAKPEVVLRVSQQVQDKPVRFPVAPFSGLVQNPIVKENVDVHEVETLLRAVCSTVEFRCTASTCEFVCVAEAHDGNEQCKFAVSFWGIPHSPSKCLIQVDRHAGCPFFFRQIVSKTVGTPCSNGDSCESKSKQAPRLFRAPKLPEAFTEEKAPVDSAAVESAIALATSNIHEQRLQGALVLADLCAESKGFSEVFKSVNGVERIACLKTDSNSYIQRAVSRILVSV